MTDELEKLKDLLTKPSSSRVSSEELAIDARVFAEMERCAPGQALSMTRKSDGEEFVLLRAEEFHHILQLAGLKGCAVK